MPSGADSQARKRPATVGHGKSVFVADIPSALIFSKSRRLPTGVPWMPMPAKPTTIWPFQSFHCAPERNALQNMPCDSPLLFHAGFIAFG